MKIQVLNDDGELVMNHDTKSAETPVGFVSIAAKAEIVGALHDATQFLMADQHIIASIKADIQAAVARIETELGAHPAFTWAQTKLGNAAAHLEAYVAGNWEEPKQGLVPPGTGYDQRGVLIALAPAAAQS